VGDVTWQGVVGAAPPLVCLSLSASTSNPVQLTPKAGYCSNFQLKPRDLLVSPVSNLSAIHMPVGNSYRRVLRMKIHVFYYLKDPGPGSISCNGLLVETHSRVWWGNSLSLSHGGAAYTKAGYCSNF
jgi:hypothetical protein